MPSWCSMIVSVKRVAIGIIPIDPDEAKLGKVCFAIGFNNPNWTVYVSEETSFEYAKKACERFLEIHPEHEAFLKEILRNWKPA